MEKITGKVFEEIKDPEVPSTVNYLIELFFELGTTRQYTDQGGMRAITYTELLSFQQLTGQELEPWEVDIIKHLDRIFINAVYEQRRNDNND